MSNLVDAVGLCGEVTYRHLHAINGSCSVCVNVISLHQSHIDQVLHFTMHLSYHHCRQSNSALQFIHISLIISHYSALVGERSTAISLSVCLSTSISLQPLEIFCADACGRGSVLLWRRYNCNYNSHLVYANIQNKIVQ